jgi:hypothetical protein
VIIMQRIRVAGICLGLAALCACDNRPVAEEAAASGEAAEAVRQPLERARAVEDLNLGRTADLDEAVDEDSR